MNAEPRVTKAGQVYQVSRVCLAKMVNKVCMVHLDLPVLKVRGVRMVEEAMMETLVRMVRLVNQDPQACVEEREMMEDRDLLDPLGRLDHQVLVVVHKLTPGDQIGADGSRDLKAQTHLWETNQTSLLECLERVTILMVRRMHLKPYRDCRMLWTPSGNQQEIGLLRQEPARIWHWRDQI